VLGPECRLAVAAQAVQGAGAALVMPLAMALIGPAIPPAERGKALGMFGGMTSIAFSPGRWSAVR